MADHWGQISFVTFSEKTTTDLWPNISYAPGDTNIQNRNWALECHLSSSMTLAHFEHRLEIVILWMHLIIMCQYCSNYNFGQYKAMQNNMATFHLIAAMPNVMTEWLTLLSCIWEVLGSNLGPETCYPDRFFLWFFISPPGKYWDNT
jgi:hypothetical protein